MTRDTFHQVSAIPSSVDDGPRSAICAGVAVATIVAVVTSIAVGVAVVVVTIAFARVLSVSRVGVCIKRTGMFQVDVKN